MRGPAPRPMSRRVLLALLGGASLHIPWSPKVRASEPVRYSEGVAARIVSLDAVPSIPVVSMHGRSTRLDRELDAAPVLLNFIFTTCSSTCSMQTAVLAELQRRCIDSGRPLRMVSITIDPDNDTPGQLRRFSGTFNIRPGWQFLTGRFDDLLQVQRHFDVYRGSKSAHPPVVLLRGSSKAPWTRIEGVASARDLLRALGSLAPAAA